MISRIKLPALILAMIATFAINSYCAVENPVPGKISKVITRYLVGKDPNLSGKRIEVSYKYADKVFKELKYRSGNVSFEVAELYPDFKPLGNVIVPIQVTVDGVDKEKLFLRTKVSVYDMIVVAKKRMKRGDLLNTENTALEERDIASLSTAVIRNKDYVIGKESKTFIPQDNAIYEWMIKDRPFVKKNADVTVIAGEDNIKVTARGIASEDGAMGQTIKVKNIDSGKEMTAVVTGSDEVTVK